MAKTKKAEDTTLPPASATPIIDGFAQDAYYVATLVKSIAKNDHVPLNVALRIVDLAVSVRIALTQEAMNRQNPFAALANPAPQEPEETADD